MGKFIAVHVFRQYNPGCFNRGEDGEAKQITINNKERVRISSQCLKHVIRELMGVEEIRTAEIEKLVNAMLDEKVSDDTITEDEKMLIGKHICSKSIVGSDCWKKLFKDNTTDDSDSDDGDDNDDDVENSKKKKGNVVDITNSVEIDALVNTFIDAYKKDGKKAFDKVDKVKALGHNASDDILISDSKALFGAMATDGVYGSVDGAVQMGQAYSLDLYQPEYDFFTADGISVVNKEKSDPYYGSYKNFSNHIKAKANAETMNTGLSLYSNLIYSYANVDIPLLVNNLCTFIGNRESIELTEEKKNHAKELIFNFVEKMIMAMPTGAQHQAASYVEPTAVLIEVINDSFNQQANFSEEIVPNEEESVCELALKELADWSNKRSSKWVCGRGKTTQYIILGSKYEKFSNLFTSATTLASLEELEKILNEEIDNLV